MSSFSKKFTSDWWFKRFRVKRSRYRNRDRNKGGESTDTSSLLQVMIFFIYLNLNQSKRSNSECLFRCVLNSKSINQISLLFRYRRFSMLLDREDHDLLVRRSPPELRLVLRSVSAGIFVRLRTTCYISTLVLVIFRIQLQGSD